MKVIKHIHDATHVAIRPITIVVDRFHNAHIGKIVHSKKASKVTIGIVIMLVGSGMAAHQVAFIPHVIWDAIAYGLHGYGALPIVKIGCKFFNLEDLDDDET